MGYGNKKKLVLPWHHSTRKPLVGFLPRPNFLLKKVIYGVIFFNFLKNAIFLSDQFIRGVKKLSKKAAVVREVFREILIIYQYFILMEYLGLMERVTIDE